MRLYFIGLGLVVAFGAIFTTYYLGSVSGGSCSPIDRSLGFATGACNNLILGIFTPLELAAFGLAAIFMVLGSLLPAANVKVVKETVIVEKHERQVDDKKAIDDADHEKINEKPVERKRPWRDYKSKDYAAESSDAVPEEGSEDADNAGQPTERYVYTTDGRRKKIERNAQKKDSGIKLEDIKGISHHKKSEKELSEKDDSRMNCPQCGSPNGPGSKFCSSCGYRLIAETQA